MLAEIKLNLKSQISNLKTMPINIEHLRWSLDTLDSSRVVGPRQVGTTQNSKLLTFILLIILATFSISSVRAEGGVGGILSEDNEMNFATPENTEPVETFGDLLPTPATSLFKATIDSLEAKAQGFGDIVGSLQKKLQAASNKLAVSLGLSSPYALNVCEDCYQAFAPGSNVYDDPFPSAEGPLSDEGAEAPTASDEKPSLALPSVEGFGSNMQTGAVTVSYPLVGGQASLSYDSGQLDDNHVGLANYGHKPWTNRYLESNYSSQGMGWGLSGVYYIARDEARTPGWLFDDSFFLVYPGGATEIIEKDGQWETKDKSFIKITHPRNSHRFSKDSDQWIVVDKSGIRYEFGQRVVGEGCLEGVDCGYNSTTGGFPSGSDMATLYGAVGTAGSEEWNKIKAVRWYLRRITDINGNEITYHYQAKSREIKNLAECGLDHNFYAWDGIGHYSSDVKLKSIVWGRKGGQLEEEALYRLDLHYRSPGEQDEFGSSRYNPFDDYTNNLCDMRFFDEELLDRVEFSKKDEANSFQVAAKNVFHYTSTHKPVIIECGTGTAEGYYPLLSKIDSLVRDQDHEGQFLSTPEYSYGYSGVLNEARLNVANNGYKGKVEYSYQWWTRPDGDRKVPYKRPDWTDITGAASDERLVVVEKKVYDGINTYPEAGGATYKITYDYENPLGFIVEGWGTGILYRRFLGFGKVTATTIAPNEEVKQVVSEYFQGITEKDGDDKIICFNPDPRKGLVKKVTTKDQSGQDLSWAVTKYAVMDSDDNVVYDFENGWYCHADVDDHMYFKNQSKKVLAKKSYGEIEGVRTGSKTVYDIEKNGYQEGEDFGFAVEQIALGEVDANGNDIDINDNRIGYTFYNNNNTGGCYLKGAVKETYVKVVGDETKYGHQKFYYDEENFDDRNGPNDPLARGWLTRTESVRYPGEAGKDLNEDTVVVEAKSQYYRDEHDGKYFGQPYQVKDALGYVGETVYDELYPGLARKTIAYRGKDGSGEQWVSEIEEFDYLLGAPLVTRDVNGLKSKVEYDSFGRTLKAYGPDGDKNPTELRAEFDYYDPIDGRIPALNEEDYPSMMVVSRSRFDDDTWMTSRSFYNGLGQEVQGQVINPVENKHLTNFQEFNSANLITGASLPVAMNPRGLDNPWYSETPPDLQWTRTVYDVLGRTVEVTNPLGHKSKTKYDGLTTFAIAPVVDNFGNTGIGYQMIEAVADHWGQVKETLVSSQYCGYSSVDECLAFLQALSPEVLADSRKTQSEYDKLGRLVKSKRNYQEGDEEKWLESEYAYDSLGTKVWMKDPDVGEAWYVYDRVGALASEITQRSEDDGPMVYRKTSMEYDDNKPGHRLVQKWHCDGDSIKDKALCAIGDLLGQNEGSKYEYYTQARADEMRQECWKGMLYKTENANSDSVYRADCRGRWGEEAKTINAPGLEPQTRWFRSEANLSGAPNYVYYPIDHNVEGGESAYSERLGYEYNDFGQVVKIALQILEGEGEGAHWGPEQVLVENPDYHPVYGSLLSASVGGGVFQPTKEIDSIGRMTTQRLAVNGAVTYDHGYQYNPAGWISQIEDRVTPEESYRYSYDVFGQLAAAIPYKAGHMTDWGIYEYDLLGNITYKEDLDHTKAMQYYYEDSEHPQRLTKVEIGIAPNKPEIEEVEQVHQYQYDAFGNLTLDTLEDGTTFRSIEYGLNNMPKQMVYGDVGTKFGYDHTGERVWKTVEALLQKPTDVPTPTIDPEPTVTPTPVFDPTPTPTSGCTTHQAPANCGDEVCELYGCFNSNSSQTRWGVCSQYDYNGDCVVNDVDLGVCTADIIPGGVAGSVCYSDYDCSKYLKCQYCQPRAPVGRCL